MNYTIQASASGEFDDVVGATITALEDEGFGVLCDIDVQATFEKKLDENFQQYRILGACAPGLAHEALNEEIELGALLPCNVVVREADDGEVVISAVDPKQLLSVTDNTALDTVAGEVNDRFERVLAAVDDS